MNWFMVALRLIHIGAGVFWAGGAIVLARFVIPAVGDAGPEGGKVVQALQKRGLMTALPVSAVISMLAGLILYWRDAAALARTTFGMTLGLGAVAAIVAFAIGISVMRPSTMKAGELAQTLSQLTDATARDARQADIQRLRARAAGAANWVAWLLIISVAAMAVARYL